MAGCAVATSRSRRRPSSEVVAVYPHRSDVPRAVWERLFSAAEREIGVLVYAGLFLAEDAALQKILAAKARAGVRVRVLLGDPQSPQVADRGADEGVDDAHGREDPQRAGALPGTARRRTARSSGSTPRSCTTRSTGPTISSWSTPTSTA